MKMYFNGTELDNTNLSQLQRAVVISLFTWHRAEDTDDYDGGSKYGWWGDSFPEHEGDRIGSKLYQLLRRKLTDDVLLEAQEMCENALQWLIDDGKADEIVVTCERTDTNTLAVRVVITVNQHSNTLSFMEI